MLRGSQMKRTTLWRFPRSRTCGNPLRALEEWKKNFEAIWHDLVVVPHKAACLTIAVRHNIRSYRKDFESYVTEADLTHLRGNLDLHDLKNWIRPRFAEQFRERCLQNLSEARHASPCIQSELLIGCSASSRCRY